MTWKSPVKTHTESLLSVLNPKYFSFILLKARKRKKNSRKTAAIKLQRRGENGLRRRNSLLEGPAFLERILASFGLKRLQERWSELNSKVT